MLNVLKKFGSSWKIIVGILIIIGGILALIFAPQQSVTVLNYGKTYLLSFFKKKLDDNTIKDKEIEKEIENGSKDLVNKEKKIDDLLKDY